ncbi:unnamed protein product [Caretta caretta]
MSRQEKVNLETEDELLEFARLQCGAQKCWREQVILTEGEKKKWPNIDVVIPGAGHLALAAVRRQDAGLDGPLD